MSDNVGYTPGAGALVAADDIAGVLFQRVKLTFGVDGAAVDVSASNPLPVVGPLTDAQLRAVALPVSGPLTDAELRATALPVSGPLTDAQIRATALPVVQSAQAVTGSTPAATPAVLVTGGIRRDADTNWPGVDEGEVAPLLINRDGRLKTASAPAQFDPIVGNITASTQTVSGDVSSVSNVVAHVTGTFAGHNSTFEASLDGGTTWVAVQGVRTNANTIELTTGVIAAAPAYAWEFSVNAFTHFRVRATAHVSGTAVWRFVLGSYATEPIPAIQSHGITGTVTVSTAASTNLLGDVGLQVRANATGAASTHHIVSAASTNVAQIKATAGRVYGYCLSNTNAAWRYVKLHNIAAATAGAGVVVTIGVPPNGKAECMIPMGFGFATAISRSIVAGAADADATAVGLNDVVGDIFFA